MRKRILPLLLTVCMLVGMLPTQSYAAETSGSGTTVMTDNEGGAAGEPTAAPTEEPTAAPTEEPTAAPTEEPTAAPTEEPTAAPTEEPTAAPTEEPTAAPTDEPAATIEPTDEPTASPEATVEPTEEPEETASPEPAESPSPEPEKEFGEKVSNGQNKYLSNGGTWTLIFDGIDKDGSIPAGALDDDELVRYSLDFEEGETYNWNSLSDSVEGVTVNKTDNEGTLAYTIEVQNGKIAADKSFALLIKPVNGEEVLINGNQNDKATNASQIERAFAANTYHLQVQSAGGNQGGGQNGGTADFTGNAADALVALDAAAGYSNSATWDATDKILTLKGGEYNFDNVTAIKLPAGNVKIRIEGNTDINTGNGTYAILKEGDAFQSLTIESTQDAGGNYYRLSAYGSALKTDGSLNLNNTNLSVKALELSSDATLNMNLDDASRMSSLWVEEAFAVGMLRLYKSADLNGEAAITVNTLLVVQNNGFQEDPQDSQWANLNAPVTAKKLQFMQGAMNINDSLTINGGSEVTSELYTGTEFQVRGSVVLNSKVKLMQGWGGEDNQIRIQLVRITYDYEPAPGNSLPPQKTATFKFGGDVTVAGNDTPVVYVDRPNVIVVDQNGEEDWGGNVPYEKDDEILKADGDLDPSLVSFDGNGLSAGWNNAHNAIVAQKMVAEVSYREHQDDWDHTVFTGYTSFDDAWDSMTKEGWYELRLFEDVTLAKNYTVPDCVKALDIRSAGIWDEVNELQVLSPVTLDLDGHTISSKNDLTVHEGVKLTSAAGNAAIILTGEYGREGFASLRIQARVSNEAYGQGVTPDNVLVDNVKLVAANGQVSFDIDNNLNAARTYQIRADIEAYTIEANGNDKVTWNVNGDIVMNAASYTYEEDGLTKTGYDSGELRVNGKLNISGTASLVECARIQAENALNFGGMVTITARQDNPEWGAVNVNMLDGVGKVTFTAGFTPVNNEKTAFWFNKQIQKWIPGQDWPEWEDAPFALGEAVVTFGSGVDKNNVKTDLLSTSNNSWYLDWKAGGDAVLVLKKAVITVEVNGRSFYYDTMSAALAGIRSKNITGNYDIIISENAKLDGDFTMPDCVEELQLRPAYENDVLIPVTFDFDGHKLTVKGREIVVNEGVKLTSAKDGAELILDALDQNSRLCIRVEGPEQKYPAGAVRDYVLVDNVDLTAQKGQVSLDGSGNVSVDTLYKVYADIKAASLAVNGGEKESWVLGHTVSDKVVGGNLTIAGYQNGGDYRFADIWLGVPLEILGETKMEIESHIALRADLTFNGLFTIMDRDGSNEYGNIGVSVEVYGSKLHFESGFKPLDNKNAFWICKQAYDEPNDKWYDVPYKAGEIIATFGKGVDTASVATNKIDVYGGDNVQAYAGWSKTAANTLVAKMTAVEVSAWNDNKEVFHGSYESFGEAIAAVTKSGKSGSYTFRLCSDIALDASYTLPNCVIDARFETMGYQDDQKNDRRAQYTMDFGRFALTARCNVQIDEGVLLKSDSNSAKLYLQSRMVDYDDGGRGPAWLNLNFCTNGMVDYANLADPRKLADGVKIVLDNGRVCVNDYDDGKRNYELSDVTTCEFSVGSGASVKVGNLTVLRNYSNIGGDLEVTGMTTIYTGDGGAFHVNGNLALNDITVRRSEGFNVKDPMYYTFDLMQNYYMDNGTETSICTGTLNIKGNVYNPDGIARPLVISMLKEEWKNATEPFEDNEPCAIPGHYNNEKDWWNHCEDREVQVGEVLADVAKAENASYFRIWGTIMDGNKEIWGPILKVVGGKLTITGAAMIETYCQVPVGESHWGTQYEWFSIGWYENLSDAIEGLVADNGRKDVPGFEGEYTILLYDNVVLDKNVTIPDGVAYLAFETERSAIDEENYSDEDPTPLHVYTLDMQGHTLTAGENTAIGMMETIWLRSTGGKGTIRLNMANAKVGGEGLYDEDTEYAFATTYIWGPIRYPDALFEADECTQMENIRIEGAKANISIGYFHSNKGSYDGTKEGRGINKVIYENCEFEVQGLFACQGAAKDFTSSTVKVNDYANWEHVYFNNLTVENGTACFGDTEISGNLTLNNAGMKVPSRNIVIIDKKITVSITNPAEVPMVEDSAGNYYHVVNEGYLDAEELDMPDGSFRNAGAAMIDTITVKELENGRRLPELSACWDGYYEIGTDENGDQIQWDNGAYEYWGRNVYVTVRGESGILLCEKALTVSGMTYLERDTSLYLMGTASFETLQAGARQKELGSLGGPRLYLVEDENGNRPTPEIKKMVSDGADTKLYVGVISYTPANGEKIGLDFDSEREYVIYNMQDHYEHVWDDVEQRYKNIWVEGGVYAMPVWDVYLRLEDSSNPGADPEYVPILTAANGETKAGVLDTQYLKEVKDTDVLITTLAANTFPEQCVAVLKPVDGSNVLYELQAVGQNPANKTEIKLKKYNIAVSARNILGGETLLKEFTNWNDAKSYIKTQANATITYVIDFRSNASIGALDLTAKEIIFRGDAEGRVTLTCEGDIKLLSNLTFINIELLSVKNGASYNSAVTLNGKTLQMIGSRAEFASVTGNAASTLNVDSMLNETNNSVVRASDVTVQKTIKTLSDLYVANNSKLTAGTALTKAKDVAVSGVGELHLAGCDENSGLIAQNGSVSVTDLVLRDATLAVKANNLEVKGTTLLHGGATIDVSGKIDMKDLVSEAATNKIVYGSAATDRLTISGTVTSVTDASAVAYKEDTNDKLYKKDADGKYAVRVNAVEISVKCAATAADYTNKELVNLKAKTSQVSADWFVVGRNVDGSITALAHRDNAKNTIVYGAKDPYSVILMIGSDPSDATEYGSYEKLSDAFTAITGINDKTADYVIVLTDDPKDEGALTTPDKAASVKIVSKDAADMATVKFTGMTVKTNLTLESVKLAPQTETTKITVNDKCELALTGKTTVSETAGKLASVTGPSKNYANSRLTVATDADGSVVVYGITNIGVLNVSDEVKFVVNGKINVTNVEGNGALTLVATVADGTVTVPAFTIGGSVKDQLTVRLQDADGKPIDVTGKTIELATALKVSSDRILLAGLTVVKENKKLVACPAANAKVTLTYTDGDVDVATRCTAFDQAVAEINNLAVKRDYTITVDTATAVDKLTLPTAKYIASLTISGGKITYNSVAKDTLTLTSALALKDTEFAVASGDTALTISTAGYALTFEGEVLFNRPLNLKGNGKDTLVFDNNGHLATKTGAGSVSIIKGSVTGFAEVQVAGTKVYVDGDISVKKLTLLGDAPELASTKAFAVSDVLTVDTDNALLGTVSAALNITGGMQIAPDYTLKIALITGINDDGTLKLVKNLNASEPVRLLTAKSATADMFAPYAGCLTDDNNMPYDPTTGKGYFLSKSSAKADQNAINLYYGSAMEAALCTFDESALDGVDKDYVNDHLIHYYLTIGEAVKAIDAMNDKDASYTIVLLKDVSVKDAKGAPAALTLPKTASLVMIAGLTGVTGNTKLSYKGDLTLATDMCFRDVSLPEASSINVKTFGLNLKNVAAGNGLKNISGSSDKTGSVALGSSGLKLSGKLEKVLIVNVTGGVTVGGAVSAANVMIDNAALTANGAVTVTNMTITEGATLTANGAVKITNATVANATLKANGSTTIPTLTLGGDAKLDVSGTKAAVTITNLVNCGAGNEIKYCMAADKPYLTIKNEVQHEWIIDENDPNNNVEPEPVALNLIGAAPYLTEDGTATPYTKVDLTAKKAAVLEKAATSDFVIQAGGTEVTGVLADKGLYLVNTNGSALEQAAAAYVVTLTSFEATGEEMAERTYNCLDYSQAVKVIDNIAKGDRSYTIELPANIEDTVVTDKNAVSAITMPKKNNAASLEILGGSDERLAFTGNITAYGELEFRELKLVPNKTVTITVTDDKRKVAELTLDGVSMPEGSTLSVGGTKTQTMRGLTLIGSDLELGSVSYLLNMELQASTVTVNQTLSVNNSMTLDESVLTTVGKATVKNDVILRNAENYYPVIWDALGVTSIGALNTDEMVWDAESHVGALRDKNNVPQFTVTGKVTSLSYWEVIQTGSKKDNIIYLDSQALSATGTMGAGAVVIAAKANAGNIIAWPFAEAEDVISYKGMIKVGSKTTSNIVMNGVISGMTVKIQVGDDNENFTYASSFSEAVSIIDTLADKSADYVIYVMNGWESDNKAYLGVTDTKNDKPVYKALTLPKNARSVRIVGANEENKKLVLLFTGSIKPNCDVTFENIYLTSGTLKNNVYTKSYSVTPETGAYCVTFGEGAYTLPASADAATPGFPAKGGLTFDKISAAKGAIAVNENGVDITVKGAVDAKNLIVNAQNVTFTGMSSTKVTNISGTDEGALRIYTYLTNKAQSQLTINGDINMPVEIGAYVVKDGAYVPVDNTYLTGTMEVKYANAAKPAATQKIATMPVAALENVTVMYHSGSGWTKLADSYHNYKYAKGLYVTQLTPVVALETEGYSAEFLTWDQAVAEINTINNKNNSYTLTLKGDIGSAAEPVAALSMPDKAASVTVEGGGYNVYIKTDAKKISTITLKCNTVFNELKLFATYKKGTDYPYGTFNLNVGAFEGTLNNVETGSCLGNISGTAKGSLLIAGGECRAAKVSTVGTVNVGEGTSCSLTGGISGVTMLVVSAGSYLETGNSDVSVKNLTLGEASYVHAKNVTVSATTRVSDDARLVAGTETVGDGKIKLASVLLVQNEAKDQQGTFAAKLDKNGKSMLEITGTVLTVNADGAYVDSLEGSIEVAVSYANNSGTVQIYDEMVLLTAPKANASLFATDVQMRAGDNKDYALYKSGKEIRYGRLNDMAVRLSQYVDGCETGYSYFKTYAEAVKEIDSLAMYVPGTKIYADYKIDLRGDTQIGTYSKYGALTTASKANSVVVDGRQEEDDGYGNMVIVGNYKLTFSGNVTVKSNTTFEYVELCPMKNSGKTSVPAATNFSIGNYTLTLLGVTADPANYANGAITKVSGSAKSGTLVLIMAQQTVGSVSGLNAVVVSANAELTVNGALSANEIRFENKYGDATLIANGATKTNSIYVADAVNNNAVLQKGAKATITISGTKAGETIVYADDPAAMAKLLVVRVEGSMPGTKVLTGSLVNANYVDARVVNSNNTTTAYKLYRSGDSILLGAKK